VYWRGFILFGEPYGNILRADHLESEGSEWTLELGTKMFPHYPSPVIARDTLYMARNDGGFYAVHLPTHTMKWQLYLGDHAQAGYIFPDNLRTDEDTKNDWCGDDPVVGQALYATPAIDEDGTIYVGTGDRWLYAIGEKK
jgi:outer membrane protein assembly factor BamB